jgi:hypothetical protein
MFRRRLSIAATFLMTVAASLLTQPLSAQSVEPVALDLQTLDRLHAPILRDDLKLLGAQSCAAASCHGGPHPGVAQPWVSRGAEYPLWIENDPHARSWRTISSEASVAMMRRLKIMQGNQIVDQKGFDNCLACHNTTQRFHEPRSSEERKEGVGCSGCHGPEEQWNGNHYQHGFDPLSSTAIGFVANGDLLTRARVCASCHVGDQDRDMNHDIIAAGHPALRYEFATFHAMEPKHWRDAEAGDRTYYEAQLWLAGQIAAADASLALLQARSTKAHTVSQWPELSAYDCSSCHHTLGLANARRTPSAATGSNAPGAAIAPLSTWNFAGLSWVLNYRVEQNAASADDARLLAALEQVRLAMESRPTPDVSEVMNAVTEARHAIAAWVDGSGAVERANFRSDRLGRIAASAAGKGRNFDSWESAAQLYLAAVAARESWPGGSSGQLHDAADRVRRGLAYPEQVSGPEYALRKRTGPAATRAEVRRSTLELVRWLGPIVSDNEPLPSADEPDPEELQKQIDDLLKNVSDANKYPQQSRPKPPGIRPEPEMPVLPDKPAQPDKPANENVRPPRPGADKPKPTLTPEELRKQLEALQGE